MQIVRIRDSNNSSNKRHSSSPNELEEEKRLLDEESSSASCNDHPLQSCVPITNVNAEKPSTFGVSALKSEGESRAKSEHNMESKTTNTSIKSSKSKTETPEMKSSESVVPDDSAVGVELELGIANPGGTVYR